MSNYFKALVTFFSCGRFKQRLGRPHGDFWVTEFSDINQKIIPFFDRYPLQGEKAKDFEYFKKVAQLIQEGAHLTADGLDHIRKIKLVMNKGKKIN